MTKTPIAPPSPAAPRAPTKPTYVKDLLLLFAVPGVIALIAALAVYVPQLLAKPSTDFIYSFCDDYECKDSYKITSSGVVKRQILDEDNDYGYRSYRHETSLRYYDADMGTYRTIDLAEAQGFTLDTSAKSKDGYTLTTSKNSGGFLFWDNYSEAWYLKNGAKRQKVELTNKNTYYSNNVTFLGWVKR